MVRESASRGFAILSIAGILSKVLSVLYVPILQGIIGIDGYGIYQQTYEIFVFLYAVLNVGMQTAIAKYVSELSALGNNKAALRTFRLSRTILTLFGLVLTGLLIISARFISTSSESPDIYIGLIYLAPAIAITSTLCAYRGYFQGKNLMTPLAVSQFLEQLFNVVVSLIFAKILMKYGVQYGSAGGTIGTSIGALLAVVYLMYFAGASGIYNYVKNTSESINYISGKKIVKQLLIYGFPITLSAGLQNFGAVVDMFNVKSRLLYAGFSNYESNMLYGVLNFYKTLIYVPLIVIFALSTTVVPDVSQALVLGDRKAIKEKILSSLRISFIISIPAALGLSVLSYEIYKVLFGTDLGYKLMLYGSCVVVFMSIVKIQSTVLQSINEFYFVVFSLAVGIILKIGSNFILVGNREININGAVVSGILCFLVPSILNHRKMCKTLKIKFSLFGLTLKPLISSIVMVAATLLIKYILFSMTGIINMGRFVNIIPLMVTIACAGLVYLYSMIRIGGITKDDIESISPRLMKKLPSFMKKNLK